MGRRPDSGERNPGGHPGDEAVRVWLRRIAGDPRQQARALLVDAVAGLLELPSSAIELAYEPAGRPYLTGAASGLHVGLSHTRGWVALAATGLGPVGVDIEVVRPLPTVALARRWLRPEEASWVSDRPADQQTRAFLQLWTYKEAIGKAAGVGLRGGGLRRAVTLPVPWPPVDPAPRLHPLPDVADLVAAAPAVPGEILLAVACHRGTALGAPVLVRVEAPVRSRRIDGEATGPG